MKNIFRVLVISLLTLSYTFAQNVDDIVMKAMKDELHRNMKDLNLGELQKPFYIAYTLADIDVSYIGASLGSINSYYSNKLRTQNTTLYTGSYKRANNNYIDANVLYRRSKRFSVPLDVDYKGIRKVFWKTSDEEFKIAAEMYVSKMAAIRNQNLSEFELNTADFSSAPEIKLEKKPYLNKADLNNWKNNAREISSVFKEFEEIYESHVSIYFWTVYIRFINSENSEIMYPLNYITVFITAETLADDGESLFDHVHYIATQEKDLPSLNVLKSEALEMGTMLVKIRNAEVFDDYYTGPVLLEKQAVSEFVIQQVFSGSNSLIGKRKPILQNEQISFMAGERAEENRLELRMNRRIMNRGVTIESYPRKHEYNGINLVGYYPVDAEGVIPNNVVLVENGVLKNFLNSRVPSRNSPKSNGSMRIVIQNKFFGQSIAPGVIHIKTDLSMSENNLKNQLINLAKDEDLDYAIIIRKFEYDVSEHSSNLSSGFNSKHGMTRPLYIYKVNLNDGSETLVRGVDVSGLNIRSLNKISSVSKNEYVYNGIKSFYNSYTRKGFFHGIPVSIIGPESILFTEAEIQQHSGTQKLRPPVVPMPF